MGVDGVDEIQHSFFFIIPYKRQNRHQQQCSGPESDDDEEIDTESTGSRGLLLVLRSMADPSLLNVLFTGEEVFRPPLA